MISTKHIDLDVMLLVLRARHTLDSTEPRNPKRAVHRASALSPGLNTGVTPHETEARSC